MPSTLPKQIVDKFFPSSKLCCHCDYRPPFLPLSVREWDCPKCGAHNHRDLCASRNDIRYRLALQDIEHDLAKGETTPVAGIASVKDEPSGRTARLSDIMERLPAWEQCKTRIIVGALRRTVVFNWDACWRPQAVA
jgi:hypothetical protein